METFNPMFLIAMPQLDDPNFARSVILVLHHSKEGAFGLIINSPTEVNLDTFAQSQNMRCHAVFREVPIFRGGPTSAERGFLLHTDEKTLERQEVLPGLFISGTPDTLKTFLEEGKEPIKFILGSAGWDAGQLESEMAQGSWITTKVDPKYIFQEEPSKLWNTMLRDMGVDPSCLAIVGGVH